MNSPLIAIAHEGQLSWLTVRLPWQEGHLRSIGRMCDRIDHRLNNVKAHIQIIKNNLKFYRSLDSQKIDFLKKLLEIQAFRLRCHRIASPCCRAHSRWKAIRSPAMLFMVIETFRDQNARAVYRRFRDKGRQMPEGLKFVSSWVAADLSRCFQLMEADDVALFQRWAAEWSDLIGFEIVPVVPGSETAAALSKQL